MIEYANTLVNSVTPILCRTETGARSTRLPAQYNRGLMDRVALLAARYPVVRRLAGDESFMEAATGFVFGLPRRKPGNFGDTFPQFLRSLGPSASIEYLADIAEFETALSKARNKAAQRSKRRLQ